MRRLLLVAALGLAGCTATQVQTDQAAVQAAIVTACNDVNGAASLAAPFAAVPQVGALLDYATASCAGANAVAGLITKAVNDPSTVAWAQSLAAKIKGAVPHA